MSEWEKVKFGELYLIPSRNGINRPGAVRGVGYRMINMGEIFKYDRIHNIDMERVLLNEKEKVNFGINKDDLIFARQSIVAEGAGKCSIVLDVSEITCFESHIIRVRLDQNKAYPLYYFYFFQSAFGKGFLSSIRQQGVQAGIRGSDLEKLYIPYPSLTTQKHIASILSAYDDLIENNLKRIKLLEELAQRTYEEWFVNRTIQKVSIEDKDFEIIPLREMVLEYMNGGWGKEEVEGNYSEEAYVLRGTDMPDLAKGNFSNLPLRFHTINNLEPRTLVTGDISIEMSNGNINNIGRSYFYDGSIETVLKKPVMCASFCKMLRPKNINFSYLIDLHLKYIQSNNSMFIYKAQAANGINNFKFEEMINEETIAVPKGKHLETFINSIKENYTLNSNLKQQNSLLKESRDILLPRLMSGKIEVSGEVLGMVAE